jgi:uncharacterized protein (DUF1501 family)
MQGFRPLWDQGQLAVLQGVGYPNPERSHFEAMDIWQSADPTGTVKTGWLGRATARGDNPSGGVPILHLGSGRLPLALNGAPGGGAITVDEHNSFRLELGGGKVAQQQARRRLLGELAATTDDVEADDLASFVRRRQVQTLTAVETLRELLEGPGAVARRGGGLSERLQLVAGLIARGFGTRIFYVSLDGFDTHASQGASKGQLANRLAYVDQLFAGLKGGLGPAWNDTAVVMATEFGRTARINGTSGTDHGTASTLLLAGGSLKRGGIVGDWPTLADNRLFENRDLAPTLEVRSVFKGLLRDHLGVEKAKLDSLVFPDSQSVAASDGLI